MIHILDKKQSDIKRIFIFICNIPDNDVSICYRKSRVSCTQGYVKKRLSGETFLTHTQNSVRNGRAEFFFSVQSTKYHPADSFKPRKIAEPNPLGKV
jgi:hypothetical protein